MITTAASISGWLLFDIRLIQPDGGHTLTTGRKTGWSPQAAGPYNVPLIIQQDADMERLRISTVLITDTRYETMKRLNPDDAPDCLRLCQLRLQQQSG